MVRPPQFVVSVPVHDIHVLMNLLAFVPEILLKRVGMCGLIVVDAGSTFCIRRRL
jgi:hypothetical protein